jgi:hypothetical protein
LVPLLGDGPTARTLPKVVSKDVERNVEKLQAKTFVVASKVKGTPLLPLPLGSEKPTYIDELGR